MSARVKLVSLPHYLTQPPFLEILYNSSVIHLTDLLYISYIKALTGNFKRQQNQNANSWWMFLCIAHWIVWSSVYLGWYGEAEKRDTISSSSICQIWIWQWLHWWNIQCVCDMLRPLRTQTTLTTLAFQKHQPLLFLSNSVSWAQNEGWDKLGGKCWLITPSPRCCADPEGAAGGGIEKCLF